MVYLAICFGACLGPLSLLIGACIVTVKYDASVAKRRKAVGVFLIVVGLALSFFSFGGVCYYLEATQDMAIASAEQILIEHGIAPENVANIIEELENVGFSAN